MTQLHRKPSNSQLPARTRTRAVSLAAKLMWAVRSLAPATRHTHASRALREVFRGS